MRLLIFAIVLLLGALADDAGATLHRYQHGYDLSGNRLHARTTLWNAAGAPFDNTRSHIYGYDALQRLIRSDFGMLDAENDALASSGGPTPYTHQWKLDILGNWRGTGTAPGLKQTYDFDGDSYPDDRTLWHVVDKANRIRRVTEVAPDSLPTGGGGDPFGPPEVIAPPPDPTPTIAAQPVTYLFYDRAGNLVTDGAYWYQYDAWNRLIQVNLLGGATFDAATGRINGGAAGTWLRRYVYDGLGRLAARLSPSIANPSKSDRYDYYYDGVRRVQEDLKLGASSGGGGGGGGGLSGQLEELHEPFEPTIADANSDGTPDFPDANTDGTPDAPPGTTHNITSQGLDENTNGTPDHQEIDANTNGTLDDAEFGDANTDGTPDYPDADTNGTPDFGVSIFAGPSAITERQYLWGPDYVDECIAQITRDGLLFFVMQDANYNVVALVPASGAGAGQVAVQYSWSPYGELLAVDHFAPVPDNRLGHQGLFVDRLDGTSLTLSLQPNTPELYYNRNRTYHPGLGRFLQKDPNATGIMLATALTLNAQSVPLLLGAFAATSLYGAGFNLYEYGASNPIVQRDPLGLDAWDDVDSVISDLVAHRFYVLGVLNEGARVASIGLNLALDIGSGFLPGSGLYDAFQSVRVITDGRGSFWDAIKIASAAFPLAKAASGLAGLKSLLRVSEYASRACNCFAASTLVDTPEGPVSIEALRIGDTVVTRDHANPCASPRIGFVTRIFADVAPIIMVLSLSNGESLNATPSHEVWTFERGWTTIDELSTGNAFMGREGEPVYILSISSYTTRTPVYNIEVDGTFTYFANGVWVHNNSCTAVAGAVAHLGQRHHALVKFLGGLPNGIIVKMDKALHADFHSILYRRLHAAGIWYTQSGGDWADHFRRNPDHANQAIEILLDVSREVERLHPDKIDGSLTQAIWRQLMAQGKVLAP